MGENKPEVEVSYVSSQKRSIPFSIKTLFFVLTILIFAMVTLNYFNVIYLPAFCEPLSFLPRQTKQTVITPTPMNFTSTEFQYDTEKAMNLLKKYVKNTIKPDSLPSDFEKIVVNQFDKSSNFFIMSFAAKDADISTFLRHETSGDIFSASIKLKDGLSTASAATVNPFLSSYFVKSYSVSSCSQSGILTSCGNSQISSGGKEDYGINIISGPKKSLTIIYACQIPKDSAYYFIAKNCVFY
jgi:hypothetical protein